MLARKTRNQRIPATYGRRHRASRARSTSLIEVVVVVIVIVVAVIADAAARIAVVIRLVVALRIVVLVLAINLRVVVAVVASGGGVAVGSNIATARASAPRSPQRLLLCEKVRTNMRRFERRVALGAALAAGTARSHRTSDCRGLVARGPSANFERRVASRSARVPTVGLYGTRVRRLGDLAHQLDA